MRPSLRPDAPAYAMALDGRGALLRCKVFLREDCSAGNIIRVQFEAKF